MALGALLADTEKRAGKERWQAFKLNAIAAHPELAQTILRLDEQPDPEDENEFAPEATDEEMQDYVPVSHQEVGETVDVLEQFGLRMERE